MRISPVFPERPSGVTTQSTYVRNSAPNFDGGSKFLTATSIFVFPCRASTFASPEARDISSVPFRSTFVLPPPTLKPTALTDLLMSLASGEAKVDARQGKTNIEVAVKNLEPPSKFGAEFLTYVLWVVTPDGRSGNTGEILIDKD